MENIEQVQEQTAEVTTQEQAKQQESPQVFKAFASEDEYKKEVQSVSSKAKYELLKELGAKNLDEVRVKFSELEAAKAELSEYSKVKEQLELLNAEKTKISEDLLVTKFKIAEGFKDEALTLAKSKADQFEGSLEKAMEDIVKKFPNMTNNADATPPSKIGAAKQPANVNMTDAERQRLAQRYPHLRGKI